MSDAETTVLTDMPTRGEALGSGRFVFTRTHRAVFWNKEDWILGVRLATEVLQRLGVAPGELVAILVAGGLAPVDEALLTAAVETLGGQALAVTDGQDLVSWTPVVLLATPLEALAVPPIPSLRRVLLTGAVGASAELEAHLARRQGHALSFGELYYVHETPGPLAVSCAAGRLHFGNEYVTVRLESLSGAGDAVAGEPARVIVSDVRSRVTPLRDFATGDVALATVCECGQDGPVASRILGRITTPTLAGQRIWRSELMRALFRTPGFGGDAAVRLDHDRGRGKDFLYASVTVSPDADPEAVRNAVDYSLSAAFGIPVRVKAATDEEVLQGITLLDARLRA